MSSFDCADFSDIDLHVIDARVRSGRPASGRSLAGAMRRLDLDSTTPRRRRRAEHPDVAPDEAEPTAPPTAAPVAFQRTYKLHRLVLSLAPYFRALLARWSDKATAELTVDLGSLASTMNFGELVEPRHLEFFFRYLYGAEPVLTQADAPAVLNLATFFELTPLAEATAEFLSGHLTVDNVVSVLNFVSGAELGAHAAAVEGACWQFMFRNILDIATDVGQLALLSDKHQLQLIQSDELCCTEFDRYNVVRTRLQRAASASPDALCVAGCEHAAEPVCPIIRAVSQKRVQFSGKRIRTLSQSSARRRRRRCTHSGCDRYCSTNRHAGSSFRSVESKPQAAVTRTPLAGRR